MDYRIAFFVLLGLISLFAIVRLTKQDLGGLFANFIREIRDLVTLNITVGALNLVGVVALIAVFAVYFSSDKVRSAISMLTFAGGGSVAPKADVGLFLVGLLGLGVLVVLSTALVVVDNRYRNSK